MNRITSRITRLTLAAAMAFVMIGCDDDDDMMTPVAVDIVATAEDAGTFNTLVAALEAASLRTTLETGGPFTVFAPTDAAFDALPAGTVDALLADPAALSEILLYHVADGTLASGDVASTPLVVTLNGQALTIGAGPTVDGASITSADIEASNGVIHIVDAVLLPVEETIAAIAAGNADFSTLVGVLDAAGLLPTVSAAGPFTVFAPTNAAFEALPEEDLDYIVNDMDVLVDVLTYHVLAGRVFSTDVVGLTSATALNGDDITITVDGSTVTLNTATVTATDIQGSNGIIHIIDQVLLPPDLELPSSTP